MSLPKQNPIGRESVKRLSKSMTKLWLKYNKKLMLLVISSSVKQRKLRNESKNNLKSGLKKEKSKSKQRQQR
jgi:hypothetical protein